MKNLWLFIKERKKFLLVPIVLMILAAGILIIFSGSPAGALLIYTIF